jgi:ABC-type antimicrobial peptide transport system permease subunit
LDVLYDEFVFVETDPDGTYSETATGKPDFVGVLTEQKGQKRLPLESEGLRIPPPMMSSAYAFDADSPEQQRITKAYTEYVDVLASTGLKETLSAGFDTALRLSTNMELKGNAVDMLKVRAMIKKLPGFLFSSYRTLDRNPTVLMTEASYVQRLNASLPDSLRSYELEDHGLWINALRDPVNPRAPKQKLFIKCREGSTDLQRSDIVNQLQQAFKSDKTQAFDVQLLVAQTSGAVTVIQLFIMIVGVIAMTMAFFILWLSFNANVRENSWEFGVLRAVGLNTSQVTFVYIYEALAVVLSAALLGTLVGLLISVSLTLQFNVFTELPFRLSFPVGQFVGCLSMSIVVAIVGSRLPAQNFARKTISDILRNT